MTIHVNEPVTIHGRTAPLSVFLEAGEAVLDSSTETGYRVVSGPDVRAPRPDTVTELNGTRITTKGSG